MQASYELTANELEYLETLRQMEDLASKKAGVYSRLLIDAHLSKKMEELEKRHKDREKALEILLYGNPKDAKAKGQVRGENQ